MNTRTEIAKAIVSIKFSLEECTSIFYQKATQLKEMGFNKSKFRWLRICEKPKSNFIKFRIWLISSFSMLSVN